MKPVWRIDGDDFGLLQGNSAGFVRILNALLSHQAHSVGKIPLSAIHLNQKDMEGDGGVDAAIDQALSPERDPTGWFDVPTCWQFKAMPVSNMAAGVKGGQQVALHNEVHKSHAKRLVAACYGYRLCIADDMPDEKKKQWEGWLLEAAKKIMANPQRPKVLTASDLASWANGCKALLIDHFRRSLGPYLDLEMWRESITKQTRCFVPIKGWEKAVEDIRRHVDFTVPTNSILTVQGEAGVGKSRCTYEALAPNAAHSALVVYTNDEKAALDFVMMMIPDKGCQAILIADECSLEQRLRLESTAVGCTDRLRIVAIDNSLQRGTGGAGEIRLTRIDLAEVEAILKMNYPTVLPDRRRGYVHLCQGFVRLAVYLCEYDGSIAQDGSIQSISNLFLDDLARRLKPEEMESVQLVALLPRVGFRDDVANELTSLCGLNMVKLQPHQVKQTAQRLKHSPGFIAFGGRYLYVTPQVIAQVAFQEAWHRWIEPDPACLLNALPPSMVDAFMEQVERAGTPAMRETVSRFFLDWALRLEAPDLSDEPRVLRLVHLIEMEPKKLVPCLRALLERTSVNELHRLHSIAGRERTRRQLVWLAEKLAHFDEFFADAEQILLRLALAETEAHLGNNASEVWASLFQIVLSGTPIPFDERLKLLEARLQSTDPAQRKLALGAVESILIDGPVLRLVSAPVMFGRLPPAQWHPKTINERNNCRKSALALATRLATSGSPVADDVRNIVVRRLSPLLIGGFIDEAQAIIGDGRLPDALLTAVVSELEQFLEVFCKQTGANRNTDESRAETSNGAGNSRAKIAPPELEARVRAWRQSLIPQDLHGRIVEIIGQEFWHQRVSGDRLTWDRAVRELAEAILKSPAVLNRELGWLCSPEAQSAFRLGQALGEIDETGLLLDRMLMAIPLAGGALLSRGYVDRFALCHPEHLDQTNQLLDRLQNSDPRIAYEVFWTAGDEVHKVQRLLQLVDAERLPPESLRCFESGIRNRSLTSDELVQVLKRLVRGAESGNDRAAHAAIHLLYGTLHGRRQAMPPSPLTQEPSLQGMLRTILEIGIGGAAQEMVFGLGLLDDLAAFDPELAVQLAVRGLYSSDISTQSLAEACLVGFARLHPEKVMKRFGEAVLDPANGWRLRIGYYSSVLSALPIAVVQDWLQKAGVAGATRIARHLDHPFVKDGQAIVPPLAQFVLERFDDDAVFQEFCGGGRFRSYLGDIAAQHEAEADVARQFLTHPLKRIREWAAFEMKMARHEVDFWRQREEELIVP
jgi:hypothetical protein